MDKSIIVLGFRFEIEFGQSIMDERITQSQHIRNIRNTQQTNTPTTKAHHHAVKINQMILKENFFILKN